MKQESSIVSPDGALSFLFGIFALLMWYMSVWTSFHQATLLSVGMTWLILSIGALIASLINMIRGSRTGNMNLLATILLGFFPGIDTLITLSAMALKQTYQPVAYGVMYMVGAVFCFGAAYRRRNEPAYILLRTVCVAAGLFCLGFGDIFSLRPFMIIGGWNLFVFALLSFYFGLSQMYPYYGFTLPQGKSLPEWFRRGSHEQI